MSPSMRRKRCSPPVSVNSVPRESDTLDRAGVSDDALRAEIARGRLDRHVVASHVAGRGGDRQRRALRHLQHQQRSPRQGGPRKRTAIVTDRDEGGAVTTLNGDVSVVEAVVEARGRALTTVIAS